MDSATTTLLVSDGTLWATDDIAIVCKADSSAAAEEVIRVTGINVNTLTIVRGVGGAGADTIGQTAALRILGPAKAESAAIGTPRTTSKVVAVSYTQIFEAVVSLSGTLQSTELYGESDESYQLAKALSEIKRDIESAFLFSRASESGAEPGTKRTTSGLKARIATNVTNASTTVTETTFNLFSRSAFRYGSPTKLLIASPIIVEAVNAFSQKLLMTQPGSKVWGVNVSTLLLPHGKLLIARNWQLEDGISGVAGLDDEAYAVDLAACMIRYLAGNGKSRDVALHRDAVKAGQDSLTHKFLGELGIIYAQEKQFARMYGASAYQFTQA
jgi:hypothetical protein